MRVAVVSAGFAVVVGVGGACSSFSGAPGTTPPVEAGTEAATPFDAASEGADADAGKGFPATPGTVDCFETTCSPADGGICCFEPDAGKSTCGGKSCATGSLTVKCDEASDCAPGESCCITWYGAAECSKASSCVAPTERLCHLDSECEKGSTCVPIDCRGARIGTCGPASAGLKTFCRVE